MKKPAKLFALIALAIGVLNVPALAQSYCADPAFLELLAPDIRAEVLRLQNESVPACKPIDPDFKNVLAIENLQRQINELKAENESLRSANKPVQPSNPQSLESILSLYDAARLDLEQKREARYGATPSRPPIQEQMDRDAFKWAQTEAQWNQERSLRELEKQSRELKRIADQIQYGYPGFIGNSLINSHPRYAPLGPVWFANENLGTDNANTLQQIQMNRLLMEMRQQQMRSGR